MAICLTPQQSDFRGYPFEGPWVQTKTQQFQKNNCTGGQTGSWVSYSKTYTSYVSIDELMAQIEDDASNYNAAGQANANSNGTCSSTCQANSYTPTYGIFAMSSSQVWTNGISNTGVLQPYSKATFLSSADLSQ